MVKIGMHYIGVMKSETRRFAMHWLSNMEMTERGEHCGLVSCDNTGEVEYMSFCWVDREHCYFISTCSSLDQGSPSVRKRWRQIDTYDYANPINVQLIIPQPKVCHLYYQTFSSIDQHNRCCYTDLKLEKNLRTKEWSLRVNMTILGMIIVDSWILMDGIHPKSSQYTHMEPVSQRKFYLDLAEQMIDNSFDVIGRYGRCMGHTTVNITEPEKYLIYHFPT